MAISITEFMNTYKLKKTDDEKIKFVKKHIKNEYVPYEKKADLANSIVNLSYWVDDGDCGKILHVDSIVKYMLTCICIIDLYTDIERQKKEDTMLEDFNILNGSGVLDIVINNVDSRELKEFNMVLQMTCDDVMTNEYENHAYITKQVDRFSKLIGAAIAPVLSNLDIDKIKEIIENMVET